MMDRHLSDHNQLQTQGSRKSEGPTNYPASLYWQVWNTTLQNHRDTGLEETIPHVKQIHNFSGKETGA